MVEIENTSQLTLIITNTCNLRCIYCYEKNKTSDVMSFEIATEWICRCLEKDYDRHLNIYLFGGEPLLQFPLIKRICEWTWCNNWKRCYSFIVQTNGTLLNQKMKKWFSQHKEQIKMCLSLDGSRDTHNKNRDNSFDKIDIAFFKETWPSQPVKMTISKFNLDNLAKDIIWLHEQGFNIRGCNFAIGEPEYDDAFFNALSIQLKELSDYYISNPSVTISPILDIPLFLLSESNSPEKISCNLGNDKLLVVNTDGSTSPCSFFSNVSFGKNERDKIAQVLDYIDYKKIECHGTCVFFPVCDMCYGENLKSTGNIYKPPANKCKLMRMRIKAAMYVQASIIAQKKEITYQEFLTINSIKKYYKSPKLN